MTTRSCNRTLTSWPVCLAAAVAIVTVTAGCTSSQLRTGGTLAGAAGGATIANVASRGNPLITAAGAAGGALLADVAGGAVQKQQENAERAGYQKGQSDSVKQLYWAQQAMQKRQEGEEPQAQISRYDIPLPETTDHGAILAPRTKTLRIEE